MHRLVLTPVQRQELVELRNSASKPYLRERAAALLKIAAGQPAARVARTGLLRPRQPDTVYRWLRRYRAEGIAGLADRPGRGRKPAFSSGALRRRGRLGDRSGRGAPSPPPAWRGPHPLDPRHGTPGSHLAGRP
jgi:hypothetical protein